MSSSEANGKADVSVEKIPTFLEQLSSKSNHQEVEHCLKQELGEAVASEFGKVQTVSELEFFMDNVTDKAAVASAQKAWDERVWEGNSDRGFDVEASVPLQSMESMVPSGKKQSHANDSRTNTLGTPNSTTCLRR
jgi:hypothetical protein